MFRFILKMETKAQLTFVGFWSFSNIFTDVFIYLKHNFQSPSNLIQADLSWMWNNVFSIIILLLLLSLSLLLCLCFIQTNWVPINTNAVDGNFWCFRNLYVLNKNMYQFPKYTTRLDLITMIYLHFTL